METQNEKLPEEVVQILSEIEAFTSFDQLFLKVIDYRKIIKKHFANDNKNYNMIIQIILNKLKQTGEENSSMLSGCRKSLIRYIACILLK